MTANLEAAAEAILKHNKLTAASTHALFALDAADPRLKLLSPEDTTAILDYVVAREAVTHIGPASSSEDDRDAMRRMHSLFNAIPTHAWEVLSGD